jgi:hypothetical protein
VRTSIVVLAIPAFCGTSGGRRIEYQVKYIQLKDIRLAAQQGANVRGRASTVTMHKFLHIRASGRCQLQLEKMGIDPRRFHGMNDFLARHERSSMAHTHGRVLEDVDIHQRVKDRQLFLGHGLTDPDNTSVLFPLGIRSSFQRLKTLLLAQSPGTPIGKTQGKPARWFTCPHLPSEFQLTDFDEVGVRIDHSLQLLNKWWPEPFRHIRKPSRLL